MADALAERRVDHAVLFNTALADELRGCDLKREVVSAAGGILQLKLRVGERFSESLLDEGVHGAAGD